MKGKKKNTTTNKGKGLTLSDKTFTFLISSYKHVTEYPPLTKSVKSVQTVTTSEERTKTKQIPACPLCFPMAKKA